MPPTNASNYLSSLRHGVSSSTSSRAPSSPLSSHTSSSPTRPSENDRLKRKVTTLEEEIADLKASKAKRKIVTTKTLGRGIKKTASMFVDVMPLVMEYYRREEEADHESEETPANEELLSEPDSREKEQETSDKRDRDRNFVGFQIVCEVVPGFKRMVNTMETKELKSFCKELDAGAVAARGDDINKTKEALVDWLEARRTKPQPPLKRKTRAGRGFRNDITGRLLCPIDLDWDNPEVRTSIRQKETRTNDNYFIRAFYQDEKGDPEDVERGFLKGDLLVKMYCYIFTSAGSVDDDEALNDGNGSDAEPSSKRSRNQRQSTRKSVAQLLNIENVTPRTIAYACVLLRFGLSEASAWNGDRSFNYQGLYDTIIDYFEEPQLNSLADKHVKKLLHWWTKQVFTDEDASTSLKPLTDFKNRLAVQRAAKEARAT